MKTSSREPVRYAVVGLGHIAQSVVLPGFQRAKGSVIGALITGDPEKARKLSQKYGAPAFSYADYEKALREEDIDAVYVALPNTQHREFTVRAARAGVHVLCEKPMATSEKDCRAMIAACARARVHLMIAYRLHFTDAELSAIKLAKSGKLGEIRYFSSVFGMQVASPNIRINAKDGGGPLYDLGVYCVNAARYLFDAEPTEVFGYTASNKDPRFTETEEMASALLRFPGDRLAAFTCSFGAVDSSVIELVGTKGILKVDPAYSYKEDMKWVVSIGGKKQRKTFPLGDQFGAEIAYFSACIRSGTKPEPDGYEGCADVRVLNAIFKAARSGRSVKIAPVKPQKRPRSSQVIKLRPTREPKLVKVKAPTKT